MSSNKKYSTYLLLLFSFLMALTPGEAQEFNDDSLTIDSTNVSIPKGENGFSKVFKGKPGRSAMWAALIPGGGHFYNGKYISGVLAAGADIFMLYLAIDQNNFYNDLNTGYLCLLREECTEYTIISNNREVVFTDAALIKANRDTARRNREYQFLYAGLTHFGTIVWAYVQAHLIDFDDSEDLSLDFKMLAPSSLGYIGSVPGLSLKINLNRSNRQLPKAIF